MYQIVVCVFGFRVISLVLALGLANLLNTEREMAKTKPYKVNPEKLKSTLLSIKARFESGTVRKMTEISDMYSTGLKKALGMGHDTFVTKFTDPAKFTVGDILRLADITDVDRDIIWKRIVEEAEQKHVKKDIDSLLTSSNKK